ncbi:hemolysin family protein [Halapricum hydrolyticum]|uniref:Hemolysin family protein n=1 Tax=Halapricum hydrolyticum TaxID=2979991 RepID=A0AAE3IGR6_9EURY|nr:hemolysin family protein [Halapricum hydrolyticum]MCU4719464.1 hemolysin family protein [Halapricum hydrolyticum]MCU4728075.1 hemolysin family protein [Halapricum hydrolyticum]
MSTVEIVVRLVAGIGLILGNAFFVAVEFALTRTRQYSREEFVGEGSRGLARAWEMTEDLEIYLTSCQVGITATSIAVGIVAEPALAFLLEPVFADTALASAGAGAVIAFLIINLVHLTHGEQTPTYLGVERTRMVARYGAEPLYWFHFLISPMIIVGDSVAKWTLKLFGIEMTGAWLEAETDSIETRAQLRNRLGSVLEKGELTDERRAEVLSALEIGDSDVVEIMIDREEIVALSTEVDLETNLDRMDGTPHVRFPLVGEDFEEFVGVVYAPTVLHNIDELRAGKTALGELATPPMTVAADTAVSDFIDQCQAENQELALVLDGGEVVGLVTATDAFEEVLGELEDPMDREL